jgi:CheY-like chemotaxis protein
MMPQMNGQETFFEIRNNIPEMPIVMMSGLADAQALESVLAKKHTAFLHKPFSTEQLLATLRKTAT